MSMKQSRQVKKAIERLRADPKLTRYRAAKDAGITPGALYLSKECRELFQERKKGAQA